MIGPGLLSGIAVMMALVLGLVSYGRLGRATVPLTLLALMAATGSMWELDIWLSLPLWLVDKYWQPLGLSRALLFHPLWHLWGHYAPGILAILLIIWLVLVVRRLPP